MADIILFWKPEHTHGYLSQWYHAPYELNGVQYQNVEQGIMKAKADLFGDTETGRKIMQTGDPVEIKLLGRQVKGYRDEIWTRHRGEISHRHNMAKFALNPHLRRQLLETGDAVLAEASPYDHIWGIGLAPSNPKAGDPSAWPADGNLLGRVLMQVRRRLGGALQVVEN